MRVLRWPRSGPSSPGWARHSDGSAAEDLHRRLLAMQTENDQLRKKVRSFDPRVSPPFIPPKGPSSRVTAPYTHHLLEFYHLGPEVQSWCASRLAALTAVWIVDRAALTCHNMPLVAFRSLSRKERQLKIRFEGPSMPTPWAPRAAVAWTRSRMPWSPPMAWSTTIVWSH